MPNAFRFLRSGKSAGKGPTLASLRDGPQGADHPRILPEPPHIKHVPFPSLPVDTDLAFELVMFSFAMISTGVQFLNMYKSVWWLENSHRKHAMNFHLINGWLALFVTIVHSRRLISLAIKYLSPIPSNRIAAVILTPILCWIWNKIGGTLTGNTFYLFIYPFILYMHFFGFKLSPLLDLVPSSPLDLRHSCSSSSESVREETDKFVNDLLFRLKQIFFDGFMAAYFSAHIPCCFAPDHLRTSMSWCSLHLVLTLFRAFVMYASHMLTATYCDAFHRTALHLGIWRHVKAYAVSGIINGDWRPELTYGKGAVVRHDEGVYQAGHSPTCAMPNVLLHQMFFALFNKAKLLKLLVGVQLFLVLVQFFLLVQYSHWDRTISSTLMLFFSYYIMFKLHRNYMVARAVYNAEAK